MKGEVLTDEVVVPGTGPELIAGGPLRLRLTWNADECAIEASVVSDEGEHAFIRAKLDFCRTAGNDLLLRLVRKELA